MRNELTAERLREVLCYSPETGLFTWKGTARGRQGGNTYIGRTTGSPDHRGYCRICVDGHLYLAHRLAWLYAHGRWPAAMIDHVNGDKSDNRIANLREATMAQNKMNVCAPRTNKSGFKGVSWNSDAGKWMAYIRAAGKSYNLGRFDTPEAAHAAYAEAAARLHGEFARTA